MKDQELRTKAEQLLNGEIDPTEISADVDIVPLLHELRVHQAELTLQNEELLRLQQELAESAEKYMAYYHSAPVGYLTLSADGIIRDDNLQARILLSEHQRSLADRPLLSLLNPNNRAAFLEVLHEMTEMDAHQRSLTVQPTFTDDCYLRLDLSRRYSGRHREVWVALTDISATMQAQMQMIESQMQLELSEMRLREAQKIGQIGSWERNLTRNIGYWSDELCLMLGYEPFLSDPSFVRAMSHFHPDDSARLRKLVEVSRSTGESWMIDARYRPQGQHEGWRWASVIGHVRREESTGDVISFGTLQDITGRKALEEDAVSLRVRSEKNKLLRKFIENVSHEFRTPLTVIKSSVELLMMRHKGEDDVVRTGGQVSKSVDDLERLLEAMLMATRIEQQVSEPMPHVALDETINWVIEKFARRQRIDVEFDHEDSGYPPLVQADEGLLEQMLLELLQNAVQHNDETPTIVVRLRSKPDTVQLVVEDNGRGISSERIEILNSELEQAPLLEYQRGKEMGMRIAYAIATTYSGSLKVDMNTDAGFVVNITLPRASSVN